MNYTDTITYYVEFVFPMLASKYNWPIRFDHCFRRVIYDICVGDKWNTKVQSPANKNMTVEQLKRCVSICIELVENPQLMMEYNNRSLAWREK